MEYIKVNHTSITIPNYNLGQLPELERLLSVWNDTYFRYDPKGFSYKPDTKELLVPRGLNVTMLSKQFNLLSDMNYTSDPVDKAVYKLTIEPRNDTQRRGVSFLTSEGDFSYTRKYSQLSLNFDTGEGKTYTAIAALTMLKVKAIVITHMNEIKNQWYNEFLNKTDIDEKYIYNIEGSSDIVKLLSKKKLTYKVYLVNHRTLYSYAKTYGWDTITELFKVLKVGVKIYDEAHLEFENLIKIDLYTNTKRTFYLTANFERAEYKENRLFKICFNSVAKYGIEEKVYKEKHIKYLAVLYNSKPREIDKVSIKNRYGFDKNAYIDYEIKQDIFYASIKYLLSILVGKGKILILVSKIEASEIIYKYIIDLYPELKVSIFNSTVPANIKKIALDAEIIISTPSSLGVGVDIKGLRYIINSEQYSSKIKANQVSGRLRCLGNDITSIYIELIDIGFDMVKRGYKKRRVFFKEKCISISEYNYK